MANHQGIRSQYFIADLIAEWGPVLVCSPCVLACSALATEAYEGGRDKVQSLVNAAHREEIIFTRNATEAINLVAHTWGTANLKPGDEVR